MRFAFGIKRQKTVETDCALEYNLLGLLMPVCMSLFFSHVFLCMPAVVSCSRLNSCRRQHIPSQCLTKRDWVNYCEAVTSSQAHAQACTPRGSCCWCRVRSWLLQRNVTCSRGANDLELPEAKALPRECQGRSILHIYLGVFPKLGGRQQNLRIVCNLHTATSSVAV